jgi:hypothetical protein
MQANPDDNLDCLEEFYWVEISSFGGNARRVLLKQLLSSPSMQRLIRKKGLMPDEDRRKWVVTLETRDTDKINELFNSAAADNQNPALLDIYRSLFSDAVIQSNRMNENLLAIHKRSFRNRERKEVYSSLSAGKSSMV